MKFNGVYGVGEGSGEIHDDRCRRTQGVAISQGVDFGGVINGKNTFTYNVNDLANKPLAWNGADTAIQLRGNDYGGKGSGLMLYDCLKAGTQPI